MPNPVGWFEIMGKDAARAQKFYADLFGWPVDANNPMNYGMVQGDGYPIGGGIGGDGNQPPRVTIYVSVDDLQATLDRAVSLGGKIIAPPMDVPGGPAIAQFEDPDGNMIGLMKPQ